MKTLILLMFIALVGCNPSSATPSQPAAQPAPVAQPATPAASQCAQATRWAERSAKKIAPVTSCECWDVDSVMCSAPQMEIWCQAKAGAKPICELAVDLRPPPDKAEFVDGKKAPKK